MSLLLPRCWSLPGVPYPHSSYVTLPLCSNENIWDRSMEEVRKLSEKAKSLENEEDRAK